MHRDVTGQGSISTAKGNQHTNFIVMDVTLYNTCGIAFDRQALYPAKIDVLTDFLYQCLPGIFNAGSQQRCSISFFI